MTTNWDDHRFFLAIAREGSLTAAGKSLGVSQPTVSRRLDALETKLRVRLFDRNRDGYQLTSVGMELFETVCQVEEDLSSIDRKIYGKDQELTGNLRVTCTEVFLNGYLSKHLWKFLHRHPGIELSVMCTRSELNLSRNDADLAIRFTSRPPETLIGRRLSPVAYSAFVVAGPAGDRILAADPVDWNWIGMPDDAFNQLLFDRVMPGSRFKHQVDSMAAMQSMTRAGLGVAVLPCYMADRDPDLRRAAGPDEVHDFGFDLWVLYHRDVRRVQRVRLFSEFVADLIKADEDLFTGKRPA